MSGEKPVLRAGIGQKTKSSLLVLFTTLIICAVVIALAVQRRKRQVLKAEAKPSSEDNWEVKREDVSIEAELGRGCFGMVYKGTLKQVK